MVAGILARLSSGTLPRTFPRGLGFLITQRLGLRRVSWDSEASRSHVVFYDLLEVTQHHLRCTVYIKVVSKDNL